MFIGKPKPNSVNQVDALISATQQENCIYFCMQ